MTDDATMILKALHDRVDGIWNWEFWAGWMYEFATFSPSGAIKQILPGSQNVKNIRKQTIQSAIISARIAESRSHGPLTGGSYQKTVENRAEDLPDSVQLVYDFFMDVGSSSVNIFEAILSWNEDTKAKFLEVGTDVAVPAGLSVMLGLSAKVAGGVAIVGGLAGFAENLITGTGTTAENYEDIEVLYEVLEQSFYSYREAEDDPEVSDMSLRFLEFYMLYLKMAGLKMAGNLNRGEIRDLADAALDTCEKYEQQMLFE